MKKILTVILAIVLVLGLAACGAKEGSGNSAGENNEAARNKIDTGAMILTEMGTVPEKVRFFHGDILTKQEGEKIQILNQNGTPFNDRLYDEVDSLLINGVCVVSNKAENGKELLGIVDTRTEKELVPCEAVDIVKLSDRFFLLGYETGEGTKEDYFDFYFINSKQIYYKGYGKVLDLEKGQFVPDLEITTSRFDVAASGNMIFVEKEGVTTDVYVADGSLAGSYERVVPYPKSGLAVQYTQEGFCIYDENMQLVSTLPRSGSGESYEPVDGSAQMLLHEYEKDGVYHYSVTDLKGSNLSKAYTTNSGSDLEENAEIIEVYPQWYLGIKQNGKYKCVDFAGNVIIDGIQTFTYVEPGYFVAKQGDGYFVYDLTGKKIYENAKDDNSLVIKHNSGKVLALETGETIEASGYVQKQTGSLVLVGTTLCDVVSGKIIMKDIENCVATGDNLYVWDNANKVYTRYRVEFKPVN